MASTATAAPLQPHRTGAKHHMNMDHSAHEGFEIDGKVDTVLSRGTVVVENDAFVGTKGHGRYVPRGLSDYLH